MHGFCNHIARGLILIEAYSFRIIEIKDIWTLSHVFINIFSLDLEYEGICIHITKLGLITIFLLYISIPEWQNRYIWSLLRPKTDAPTIIGLLRVTLALPICAPTSVSPSCLAYLNEGLRTLFKNAFSSRSLLHFMSLTS